MTVHGPAPAPSPRTRGRRLLAVTAAVVAVAAVAAALVVVRAAAPRDCSASSPTVAVAADPAVAAPLAPALGAEQRTADGACVRVRLTARRAADVARDIAAGQGPQLWVADSTASVRLALPARTGAAPAVEVGAPLVRTPLVAVTDPATAERAGWAQAPPTWRALLGGPLPVAIADPLRSGEGLAALLSTTATLGVVDLADPPVDVVSGLVRLSRTQLADPADAARPAAERAADAAGSPAGAPAAVATEQAVLASGAGGQLAVAYPAEGSVPLDHPVVRVRRPAEPADLGPGVTAVESALRSAPVLAALQRAGFRDPAGALSPDVLGDGAPAGVTAAAPPVLPAPPPPVTDAVLGLWTTIGTPTRLLTVVDVSGSMREPAPSGATRIELARDAALTGLALFSEDSAAGLWAFSRDLAPGTDWRELSPVAPLDAPEGAGTHREAAQAAVAALPGLVGGGTGLYDTALAAVREVQRGYRQDLINAVVVFTDGRNDDPVGIDRAGLVETLRAEANPARPVPLFTIGIGPDADLDELTALSEATGGQAYLARDPAEVERVFFDAYARWTCRGAC